MGCGTSRTTTKAPCGTTTGSYKEEEEIQMKSSSKDENSFVNCSACKKNMNDHFANEDAVLGENSFEVKSNEISKSDQKTGEQISSLLPKKEIGSILTDNGLNNKERSLEMLSEGIQQRDNDNPCQNMENIPRKEENFVTIIGSQSNVSSQRFNLSSDGILKPHPNTYDSRDNYLEPAADSRTNFFGTSFHHSSPETLKSDQLSFNSRDKFITVGDSRTSLGPIFRETSDASARFILTSQPSFGRKSVKHITHLGNSCTSPTKLKPGPLNEQLDRKETVKHTELKTKEQPGENEQSKASLMTLDIPQKVPVNPQSHDYLEFERKMPVNEALQVFEERTQKLPQFSNESYIQENSLAAGSAQNCNENLVYVSQNINEEVLNQPLMIPRSVKQQSEERIVQVN